MTDDPTVRIVRPLDASDAITRDHTLQPLRAVVRRKLEAWQQESAHACPVPPSMALARMLNGRVRREAGDEFLG